MLIVSRNSTFLMDDQLRAIYLPYAFARSISILLVLVCEITFSLSLIEFLWRTCGDSRHSRKKVEQSSNLSFSKRVSLKVKID